MADPSLILFDGECSACNRWVRFVLDRDPAGRFRFAALQSAAGRAALEAAAAGAELPDSVVLIRGDRCWFRSGAALRIAAGLRWPWPLLAALLAVPAPLRDLPYRWIAARRHRRGRHAGGCPALSAAQRARFLDADERT